MKRIILSLAVIVFVGALVVGATGAFFSDEETSTGNVLAAGAIDLLIDNSSYVTNNDGDIVFSTSTSWQLSDLDDQLFFNFTDLKPGDIGEDTISLHVNNNDAYACMRVDLTETNDNGLTEPESEDGDVTEGDGNGELQNFINFVWWVDDGDNVLEEDEDESAFFSDTLADMDGMAVAISDTSTSSLFAEPLEGGSTHYIAKAWCFGDLTLNPVAEDAGVDPTVATGVLCNGAAVDNTSQTDSVELDLSFYAVQSRNNGDFLCSEADFGGGTGTTTPREIVGANLSDYVAPTLCDVTVATSSSIQDANDAAGDGDVICVDPSYNSTGDTFPVNLTVSNLTVAGLGSAGDANIPGGFFVDADGVTVTGLEFTDFTADIQASDDAALYVHNEAGQGSGDSLNGATISYNIFTAPAGAIAANAKGIITEIGSGAVIANDLEVMHNVFDGWSQAMFFNTANYNVHHNDIYNNNVGVANDGPDSSSIHHNDFDGNIAEAVGVAPSAIAGTSNDGVVDVNTNNFAPAGLGNNVNWYGSSVLGGADVDATGNWWSGEAEAARTNDTAEVDTSSPEAVAFPEN